MPSSETDQRDRRERGRILDQALADDRRGRDRLVQAADEEIPPSHRDQSRELPGVHTGERL
jgi:hypothetical protein